MSHSCDAVAKLSVLKERVRQSLTILFSHPSFDDHEKVTFVCDPQAGLKAVIAIHSTVLGPGSGGVRMAEYISDETALKDAMRLSQAMSYKNAMANLNFGGAKAVIIGHPETHKSAALLQAFGKYVHALGGDYVTAADAGMTAEDIEVIAAKTPYVAGIETSSGPSLGDPALYTAHGLTTAMRAALQERYGSGDLAGRTIAIQGVGKVGSHLAAGLHRAGAKLILAGRDQEKTAAMARRWSAEVVSSENLLKVQADILAPCAFGGVFHDDTIGALRCPIIVGGANNQLAMERHGAALQERGILYVPDYIANAGGMIAVALDYTRAFTTCNAALDRVESIGETVREVLRQAHKRGAPTNIVADLLARRRIARQ